MYFIGKIYQSVKAVVALAGVSGSLIAIIVGVVSSGGVIFIVGGSLCLANSLFNIIEIGKVNFDIKKQIKNLEDSIKDFVAQSNRLEHNIDAQARENSRLKNLVNKSEQHIEKLEDIQSQILATKDTLQKEVTGLHAENQNLSSALNRLHGYYDQYAAENKQLHNTVEDLQLQVNILDKIKEDMVTENDSLHNNNEQLKTQITKQVEIIKESKNLIQNLAQFGDRYTAFEDTLGNDLIRLETTSNDLDDTAGVLRKLVDKLKNETFNKLDLNNDGIITREEFYAGLDDL